MTRNDIRTLRVTDEAISLYSESDYPTSFEFYLSFLQTIEGAGQVPKSLVALEILLKLFSQKAARISVDDMIELLPIEWQGDVVPVPMPVLETLMVPYAKHAKMPENQTLGQAWGLEGLGTNGQRRAVQKLKSLKKDYFLASQIEELYHLQKFLGENTSVETLIQDVAVRRGASVSRTRKAYDYFKMLARGHLERLGLFSEI